MNTIYNITSPNTQQWLPDYFNLNIPTPVSASIFGLMVIDADRTLRRRIPTLKTSNLMIPFQYIESIPPWQKAANYQDLGTDIIGRFSSIEMYQNSPCQEISFEIIYHAEQRYNYGSSTYWTLENIEKLTKRIQAMVFPIYTNGYSAPPKLKLNIGNIFVNVPIYIKNVEIKNEQPYDILTGLSMVRKIAIQSVVDYPMWQAITGDKIYVEKAGNAIFAYQDMDPRKLSQTVSQLSRQQRLASYRTYLSPSGSG